MNGEETSNGRGLRPRRHRGPMPAPAGSCPGPASTPGRTTSTSPFAQDKTIVVGLDDSSRNFSASGADEPSRGLRLGRHRSRRPGLDIERAGLVDGILYGVRVGTPGSYDANEGTVTSGERFELVGLSDQTNNATFAPLQTESIAKHDHPVPPRRGRAVGPQQPERLLLRHHRTLRP